MDVAIINQQYLFRPLFSMQMVNQQLLISHCSEKVAVTDHFNNNNNNIFY